MELNKRENEGMVFIDIIGEIDLYNAGSLKETLNEFVAAGKHRVILNMENVPYIDSTGIGVMLSLMRQFRQRQGDLKLAVLSPAVKKVFQLTNLTNFFSISDSEKAAIVAFNLPPD